MSDFYQHDVIATLHRLGNPSLKKLEKDLVVCSKRRHIALIIPVVYLSIEAGKEYIKAGCRHIA